MAEFKLGLHMTIWKTPF